MGWGLNFKRVHNLETLAINDVASHRVFQTLVGWIVQCQAVKSSWYVLTYDMWQRNSGAPTLTLCMRCFP